MVVLFSRIKEAREFQSIQKTGKNSNKWGPRLKVAPSSVYKQQSSMSYRVLREKIYSRMNNQDNLHHQSVDIVGIYI